MAGFASVALTPSIGSVEFVSVLFAGSGIGIVPLVGSGIGIVVFPVSVVFVSCANTIMDAEDSINNSKRIAVIALFLIIFHVQTRDWEIL